MEQLAILNNVAGLTAEQQEAVDEFQNVMENPYPWEEVE